MQKYSHTPHELGIQCHHRVKTKRHGLCTPCYKSYLGVVNPKAIERSRLKAQQQYDSRRSARIQAKHEYYYDTTKWVARDKYYRKTYSLTIAQFNHMLETQEESCFICKVKGNGLHVDHDHRTNRVRGLLCWRCNKGLAVYRDNPGYFKRAVEYLERDYDGRMLIVKGAL